MMGAILMSAALGEYGWGRFPDDQPGRAGGAGRVDHQLTETPGGLQRTIHYGDLIAVDVATGRVRQVATGFNSPVAVTVDEDNDRLLVIDFADRAVYAIEPTLH